MTGRYRRALRALGNAQKPSAGAPIYSRFVNRPAGRCIAALAYQVRMTPNQVTAVSAALSAAAIGALMLAPPSTSLGVVVAALLALGYAADAADGQLARLTGRGSMAGEWLDHCVDAAKICGLHLAVLIAFYRHPSSQEELLGVSLKDIELGVALCWVFVGSVSFFTIILNEQLRLRAGFGRRMNAGSTSVLRAVAVSPTDFGVLLSTFVLFGNRRAFVLVYALMLVANIGYYGAAATRWYREFAAMRTPFTPAGTSSAKTPVGAEHD